MSTNKYYYDVDKCCMVDNPPPISKNLLNVNYDNLYSEGYMCDFKYSIDKTLTNLSYSEKIKKVHIL
jgi:hypothetical protein